MQNSIFDIFGNQTLTSRTTTHASKPTNGGTGGSFMRGPVKPNATGSVPKKVLGDLKSNVLSDVKNIGNRSQLSTNKGGLKNVALQNQSQCKPGTSFGFQKPSSTKLMAGSKLPIVLKENNIQTTVPQSQSYQCDNDPFAVSCGVGSVFPKHLQLTVEDIDALGNLTSFRMKPEEYVIPEIFPVEEEEIDLLSFEPRRAALPLILQEDLPAVHLSPSK